MAVEVGSIVEGKVTGITNFGAFVELPSGETGLIHISEVADAYVKDINDYLKKEETVRVKIINVKEGKIGLSIKALTAKSEPADNGRSRRPRRPSRSFEDKLASFLKDSDARQADLRKSLDTKRGGRGGPPRF